MNYRYFGNGASLNLNPAVCTGCARCTMVCPHAVFEMYKGKASIKDRGGCMECGACAKNCPVSAINVKAGVGCAGAIIQSMVLGGKPTCGCSENAGNNTKCG
jgi:ferredoxin